MDGDSIVTRPHRFTVADYYRMAEAGIFNEDSRVELIRGQIVDLPPIGAPHFAAVNRLNRLLVQAVDDRAIVSVQNPVRLDDGGAGHRLAQAARRRLCNGDCRGR